MGQSEQQVAQKYAVIAPLSDERQRRVWLGVEARAWGSPQNKVAVRGVGCRLRAVAKSCVGAVSWADASGLAFRLPGW